MVVSTMMSIIISPLFKITKLDLNNDQNSKNSPSNNHHPYQCTSPFSSRCSRRTTRYYFWVCGTSQIDPYSFQKMFQNRTRTTLQYQIPRFQTNESRKNLAETFLFEERGFHSQHPLRATFTHNL